jgi:response regulator RpfG family c-di-GMP phosphodiesterase
MSCNRVILIDDEPGVLRALERVLRREPFEVTTTTSPSELLHTLRSQEFAVIVSDQRMPDIQGTELLEQSRSIAPHAVRITLTGYADKDAAIDAINRGSVSRFLTKPWDDDVLRREIRDAVDSYNLRAENRRLLDLTQRQNAELREINENLEARVAGRTAEITRLNQDLRRGFAASIFVIAQLGEMHSPVVGSHSKRVARLAQTLAEELGLSRDEVFTIYSAALLHDIGMTALPADLVSRDFAALNLTERELLKRHVVEGERITGMVPNLSEAAPLVRGHHERWDGAGYPDRLAGQHIPLGARIIAVCDAYDHALNSRTRFTQTSPAAALAEVVRHRGEQFDPHLVDALESHLRDELDDPEPAELGLRDLRPGMILAGDVETTRGLLLLKSGTELTDDHLHKLRTYRHSDPIAEPIAVLRTAAEPVSV